MALSHGCTTFATHSSDPDKDYRVGLKPGGLDRPPCLGVRERERERKRERESESERDRESAKFHYTIQTIQSNLEINPFPQ